MYLFFGRAAHHRRHFQRAGPARASRVVPCPGQVVGEARGEVRLTSLRWLSATHPARSLFFGDCHSPTATLLLSPLCAACFYFRTGGICVRTRTRTRNARCDAATLAAAAGTRSYVDLYRSKCVFSARSLGERQRKSGRSFFYLCVALCTTQRTLHHEHSSLYNAVPREAASLLRRPNATVYC